MAAIPSLTSGQCGTSISSAVMTPPTHPPCTSARCTANVAASNSQAAATTATAATADAMLDHLAHPPHPDIHVPACGASHLYVPRRRCRVGCPFVNKLAVSCLRSGFQPGANGRPVREQHHHLQLLFGRLQRVHQLALHRGHGQGRQLQPPGPVPLLVLIQRSY